MNYHFKNSVSKQVQIMDEELGFYVALQFEIDRFYKNYICIDFLGLLSPDHYLPIVSFFLRSPP